MNISHLHLVGIVRGGFRYPIAGAKVFTLARLPADFELTLEHLLPIVRKQHAPHEVVVDARPWLVFAGTSEQAQRWARSHRMQPDQWREVVSLADVRDINVRDWQITAIGTWQRNVKVRQAALAFALRGGDVCVNNKGSKA